MTQQTARGLSSVHPVPEPAEKITANIKRVMRGQSAAIEIILAAFVSGGHVLLEDVPGTGKTTMAKTLARSVDAVFSRIQFTPDLLPSDILGVSVFSQKDREFHFRAGPVFTNVLLADEINRASPRTQSALLEAMAENQVSIDGKLRPLRDMFFVIATQNPVETVGTYPLPEGQMDRFAVRISLGYVSAEEEVEVLTDQSLGHPLESVSPVANLADVLRLREAVMGVRATPEIARYVVDIVRATRNAPGVKLGASPRASLALMKTAQALALLNGSGFVTPDHVQRLVVPVMAHRLVMDPQARFSGTTAKGVLESLLKTLPAPA